MVLESQLPHKIVNLLFTFTDKIRSELYRGSRKGRFPLQGYRPSKIVLVENLDEVHVWLLVGARDTLRSILSWRVEWPASVLASGLRSVTLPLRAVAKSQLFSCWLQVESQLFSQREVLGLEANTLISHKVFLKSFCKSQFPHKSVNLFFISVTVKDKLTDLWGS